MTTYLGKSCSFCLPRVPFVNCPSIYVFSYFPFGFEGRIWDLTVSVPDHCLSFYFDRLPFNRWLKLFNCQIFSQLAFRIKGSSPKTYFISSIFRLLCIALWHYVREHITRLVRKLLRHLHFILNTLT